MKQATQYFTCILFIMAECGMPPHLDLSPTLLHISGARVITHDPTNPEVTGLISEISHFIPNTRAADAVTNASMKDVSLLNRLLYDDQAKLDERQMFNTRMVGCFLAHKNVWRQIPPHETWLILEDDAIPLPGYKQSLLSLGPMKYSYINLGPSKEVRESTRDTKHPALHECPQGNQRCHVIGAIAYLLTHDGAQRLLRHSTPIEVPVDWYMSVLRDYLDPEFSFAFTDVMFSTGQRASTIGHECLHCRLPRSESVLYFAIIGGSIAIFTLGCTVGYLSPRLLRNYTLSLDNFPVTMITSGLPCVSLLPNHFTYGMSTKNNEAE